MAVDHATEVRLSLMSFLQMRSLELDDAFQHESSVYPLEGTESPQHTLHVPINTFS